MHFQAGNRGFMPIEHELDALKARYGKLLSENAGMRLYAVDDGLRRFHVAESASGEILEDYARHAFQGIRDLQDGEEPMINMLAYFEDGWQVLLFPRDKHRPWQYFEEGDRNILLSPASVDMGGTLITPLEKDFNKISREDIMDIFSQVSFSAGNFEALNLYVKNKLQDHGK